MENGQNKEVIVEWENGHKLHAIIVPIKLEMCINFAQLYLRNGQNNS